LFVAAFMVEGALRPDYDPMRHPVSLLSLGDAGSVQVVIFIVTGTLLVAFAAGLRRVLGTGRAAIGGPVAVGISGVGLVLAGSFSADPSFGYPPGAPAGVGASPSAGAYVHVLGAFLLFGGLIAGSWLFAARFRATGRRGWATYSLITGVVVLGFFGASSGGPDGLPIFPAAVGLLQRISIIAGFVWMMALASALLGGAIEQRAASPAPAARR
jgi:hypothetical protein